MNTSQTAAVKGRKIDVFCVDDNPLATEAVGLTIESRGSTEVQMTGSAASADALLHVAQTKRWSNGGSPDIVLLDIDMPGKSPFEAIGELEVICGRGRGKPRIIMYTGILERRLIERALDCGAWGYVVKSDPPEDLMNAIREVAAGSLSFSSTARALMA